MKKLIAAGLITSALMMGGAFAQSTPRVSPQAVIVNPVQTELQTKVWLDRQGDNPIYNIGDKIRINVSVNQDAYVYIFSIHSDGVIDLILPNRLSGGGEYLRANETRSFPPSGANYQLNVDGPAGQDKILAVASKRQLNVNEIASFKGNQPFATANVQGQEGLARTLAVVVTPVEPQGWTTAYTQFQVRPAYNTQPAPAPVVSNPAPTKPGNGTSINVTVNIGNGGNYNEFFSAYGLNFVPSYTSVRIMKRDANEFDVMFASNQPITVIANTHRSQLEARGWVVSKAKYRNDNVRLEFRRGGDGMMLRIDRAARGMFRLSVEIN
jgi:Domain of unknown function (DUF4384)